MPSGIAGLGRSDVSPQRIHDFYEAHPYPALGPEGVATYIRMRRQLLQSAGRVALSAAPAAPTGRAGARPSGLISPRPSAV